MKRITFFLVIGFAASAVVVNTLDANQDGVFFDSSQWPNHAHTYTQSIAFSSSFPPPPPAAGVRGGGWVGGRGGG